jgi:ParB family chromosome partitioning protein
MLTRIDSRLIPVERIVIGDRVRKRTDDEIARLAQSIELEGLLQPIGVGIREVAGGGEGYVLIWGAARLRACKLLGRAEIEAMVLAGSESDFKRAELIENLVRPEMTVLQQAEGAARLVELYETDARGAEEPAQIAQVSKGGRGKRGGVSDAARNFGIERRKLQRLLKIADITAEAKVRAAELSICTESALLEIAGVPQAEQVAKAEELAGARSIEAAFGRSAARWQKKRSGSSKAESTSESKAQMSHLDAMHEHWIAFWELYDSADRGIRDAFLAQNKLRKEVLSALCAGDHSG